MKEEDVKELKKGLKKIKNKKVKFVKNKKYELAGFYRDIERLFIIELNKQ